MDRLAEFLRVIVRDDLVIEIKEIASAIFLEDGAEDPAMAVVIGELRVLELRVQLGDALEEIEIVPESARGGGLGILARVEHQLRIGGIMLDLRIHELAV